MIDDLSAPRKFDLIWVGSVLTHLSEALSVALIRKLMSFLNENGLLIASTHGRFADANAERAQNYGVAERWSEITQGFSDGGYGYVDYPLQSNYGISLTKPSWTARLIEGIPEIRLVLLSERAWDGHHDVLALQNAPASVNAAW
ncbi:MAG: hypothetical protein H7Z10_15150 [Gemmatimonadaceae bacterium]|nr:hypothetical protein [Acetobacteraceae bacterium]